MRTEKNETAGCFGCRSCWNMPSSGLLIFRTTNFYCYKMRNYWKRVNQFRCSSAIKYFIAELQRNLFTRLIRRIHIIENDFGREISHLITDRSTAYANLLKFSALFCSYELDKFIQHFRGVWFILSSYSLILP